MYFRLCKPDQLDVAQDLLEDKKLAGIQPDLVTFNSLIDAAEKAKNLQAALRWLNLKFSNIQPDIISYNTCISSCDRFTTWHCHI